MVLAGWIRLPEGAYPLGAVILLPALLLPFLWQVVSMGVFTSYIAAGNLLEAASRWRARRRGASQGAGYEPTGESVSARRRMAMHVTEDHSL